MTLVFPKPHVCTYCQLFEGHELLFEINAKYSLNPLDLVHCDLYGPSSVCSHDVQLYYVIFVDNYSRFTWFYLLKTKASFYSFLAAFIKLVQTQCSRKIKLFQSDGGSKFVNHIVQRSLR